MSENSKLWWAISMTVLALIQIVCIWLWYKERN